MTRVSRNAPLQIALREELVVDTFAGAGGASIGIEAAIGRQVDIAINHDAAAIAAHEKNHPLTKHYHCDVFEVDPVEATGGRPIGLAWFSPDCTHHSKAKGGKPRDKKIRALAWVVIRWAAAVRPRVIMLENVEEFANWGPLRPDGRPCPKRKGKTFREWKGQLESLGYEVEHRELVAADYGAPTTRKRLFLVARCDGKPIVWPKQTHGKGRSKAWRTAAEIIDWSLPCPSIFGRKKPLAEKTMARIAKGLERYVFNHPQPFIVTYYGARPGSASSEFRGSPIDEPVRTQTTENRFALCSPYMVKANHGGEEFRGQEMDDPLQTVTSKNGFAVCTPHLLGIDHQSSGASSVWSADSPLTTITAKARHAVVSPILTGVGGPEYAGKPRSADAPLNTLLKENHTGVVSAFLAKHYGGVVGHEVDRPVGTVTSVDHHSVVQASLLAKLRGTSHSAPTDAPLPTITAGGMHLAEVRAFLIKYYGAGCGQSIGKPCHTVTTKDRLGLVTIAGDDYQLVDIGLRMLQPHELMAAQGFPDWYQLDGTKATRVRLIGNSVCPPVAEALVRANYQVATLAEPASEVA